MDRRLGPRHGRVGSQPAVYDASTGSTGSVRCLLDCGRLIDGMRGKGVSRDLRVRPIQTVRCLAGFALATGETEVNDPSEARFRRRYWMRIAASLALSGLVLLTLLATGPQFGMVWDESYTVKRERLLNAWFAGFLTMAGSGQWRTSFTKAVLDHYWLFSREEPHGHPPFYALVGLAGWRLSHRWLAPWRPIDLARCCSCH